MLDKLNLASPPLATISGFLKANGLTAWLVGGSVRDLVLKEEPHDIDLATLDHPEELARGFADAIGGSFFFLSEEFATCRVVSPGGETTFDFAQLRGGNIESDLRSRDFTVNAMALELPEPAGLIDPFGAHTHLGQGILVAVGPRIFEQDPLRLLRAVRLEKTLAFTICRDTEGLIRNQAAFAARPAVERTFAELAQILEPPDTSELVERLHELRLLAVLLPEVVALRGLEQNEFHHLDVYGHSLETVAEICRLVENPAREFPQHAEKIAARLRRPLAGDAGFPLALSLTALFHDVAKPDCYTLNELGKVRFLDHERLGAELARKILNRFKVSSETTKFITGLIDYHLQLGLLLNEKPLSDRALLRFLRATAPYTPEAIMLSVSDRLSVRGPGTKRGAIARHLALAREMMDAFFAEEEAGPLPQLLGGDELMQELDLKPGPLVGKLLDSIYEEQKLGNVSSREQALDLAARLAAQEKDKTNV